MVTNPHTGPRSYSLEEKVEPEVADNICVTGRHRQIEAEKKKCDGRGRFDEENNSEGNKTRRERRGRADG